MIADAPAPVTLSACRRLLAELGLLADAAAPLPELAFSGISCDSRDVAPGSLFVCKGAAFREEYLDQALAAGAAAYVSQTDYGKAAPCLRVTDIRAALGPLSDLAYGHPSGRLHIAGLTGTKGKTTTAFFLKSMLDCWREAQGLPPCGLLSSVLTDDGAQRRTASLTTPEATELQRHLWHAAEAGCEYLVMEVSSQALAYGRVTGTELEVAAFLNIGEDHISPKEHPDLEDYFRSKLRIFELARTAVVNLDEPRCREVLAAAARCERILTYSMQDPSADIYGRIVARRGGSIDFSVVCAGGEEAFVLPMAGDFNVSNALAAIAVCRLLGVPEACVKEGLARAKVPGRMEVISGGGRTVIVDYAHNGMSLAALLQSVRAGYPRQPVTVVFGCTGGKGLIRRSGMGEAAASYADRIILTEDDPGPEDVEAICAEVGRVIAAAGREYDIIADREEAIRTALAGCPDPGVVVLAGKGDDQWQLRKNGRQSYPSDGVLARKYLA
ncbi:MAG: UDP-N-acetylmuramoyl-L-alanyl-D-glutamate--2,6-diaminopimelate ligase [Firmicutes bacterium]|nr:UDP-N-acetylmuramoyl-L-alanyl-D-glutamate--2,6-diaminopimelate ligase [Bacillota bacterium]